MNKGLRRGGVCREGVGRGCDVPPPYLAVPYALLLVVPQGEAQCDGVDVARAEEVLQFLEFGGLHTESHLDACGACATIEVIH